MTTDFTIKQHDLLPEITGVCADALGVIPDISGSTVRFIMTNKATGVKKIDAAANIVSGPAGVVEYIWAVGDTDEAGSFKAEYEVTFPSGKAETFPNSKNLNVKIFPDLGGVAL